MDSKQNMDRPSRRNKENNSNRIYVNYHLLQLKCINTTMDSEQNMDIHSKRNNKNNSNNFYVIYDLL